MVSGNEKRPDERHCLRHMLLINYGERISTITLAMGYLLLNPFRHVLLYYSMPWSSLAFFCSDLFRHETFHRLFLPLARFPLVLGCSHPLVSIDTESSEVQETPDLLFLLPFDAARASYQFSEHQALRQSRVLIGLLHIIASMLSLPVFIRVSR